jgi:hypothetical protein
MHYQSFFRKTLTVTVLLLSCLWHLYSQSCNPLPVFNQQFNNQTLNQAQTFTAQNIRVTGTVNFNANITMVRCTVLMDPGAVLNINNSTFSLLDNAAGRSVIYGCNSMWQSINVNANSAVILRNSNIRDGRLGFVFQQGFINGVTQISGCTFARNSASITATNVNNLTFATFSGNTFTGFLPTEPLLPPHVAGNPVNAIRLSNCSGTIGTSGAENLVRRMSVGARVTNNSNITFNNIHFATASAADNENGGQGIGVHVIASSLTIQNIFSNNASCRFSTNRRGIRSEQTVLLTIRNAIFQSQGVSDIEVVNSTNPYNVNISSNTMNLAAPSGQSILLNRAAQAAGINTRIQSNIINLQWGAGTIPNPIRIINVTTQAGATDQVVIANNQITCAYGNPVAGGNTTTIDGIFITGNADGYQVSGNIISYPFANAPNAPVLSVAVGMLNVNGVNNIVGPNNTITTNRFPAMGNTRDSWLRCGIHIDGSLSVAVCKNDADDPRHTYHFLNNCANIEFGRNKIRSGIIGLEIWNQIPNNHDYRMNEWVPGSVYNTSGARNLLPPFQFRWLVDGTNGNPLGYLPPSFTPAGWFNSLNNGQTSGTPICDAVVPPLGGFGEPPTGEMVHKFLNNEYGGMGTAAAAWDFERNLLAQMVRFPATFAGNSEAESYYNGKVNSAVWKFAKAERMLHDASAISSTDQQSLNQLYSSSTALADSLGAIEQWEGADTKSANPSWQAGKASLLAQISTNQAQIAALNASISASRLANLDALRDYVEDLPQGIALEANFRTLLLLMVKQHSEESWTEADSTALRAIAYSCPATGGEAVTMAREMLPSPEAYSFGREGFDPLCGEGIGGGGEDRGQSSNQASAAAIWPNPANDLLTVDFGRSFTGALEVLSASGFVVRSVQVNDLARTSLPTTGLPNGVYFLRTVALGQPAQTQKFTIIR